MRTSASQELVQDFLYGNITRRDLIRRLTTLGLSMPAIGAVLSVCGSQTSLVPAVEAATAPAGADVEAAKKDGKVFFWHGEQEADVVKFAKLFSDKYGIKTEWERLLPGKALPKLDAGLQSNTLDLDVMWMADPGIMEDQRRKGRLMRYISPEMKDYTPEFKSNPEGYWAAYYINVGPIMYSPRFVKKEEAPKTWLDLLDPKWKGQVGFQDSTAGTQYAWWYLLRPVVPKDYFDRLAENQPRAYDSSTQQLDDIQRGELKIGGKVSIFQYVKALRVNQPVEMVMPPEGVPSNVEVSAILASTKRPNAAKLFTDYLLSREGQKAWNEIQGSYSPRKDVTVEGLPNLATIKLLWPKDLVDYSSLARHQEFVKVWNQVTGLK